MGAGYRQGIRRNWRQFCLQVVTVFAVGLTMGTNRTVVPVMGEETFGVESVLVVGAFVVSFGVVKAVLNLYAGKWADVHGRRSVLVVGWLVALPIPAVLIVAPNWWWVVAANVLLGINQGVAWSASMLSKLDLAAADERGTAVGIDEAFGYAGVAAGAWITGVIAADYGLRPEPFYLLLVVLVLSILLAVGWIEETRLYAVETAARSDEGTHDADDCAEVPFTAIVRETTYGDRTLFAAAQAGHVENFVDTLVWIAFPLFLVSQGLSPVQVGVVVGVHSGAYFLQAYTGRLGDQIGRKPPIVAGFVLAGTGILGMATLDGYYAWIGASGVAGVGMAIHYPNLLSVVSDATDPRWRATGLGVYRLWRDLGYAVGAVLIGLAVDFASLEAAFYWTAGAMFVSGGLVTVLMEETHPELGTHERSSPSRETKDRCHGYRS